MSSENNLVFISPNHFDDAVVEANPAPVSTLPASHLQVVNRARIMKTQATTEQTISFSLTEFRMFAGFAITRHDIPTTATVQLELWEGENQTGTKVYDSGQFPATEALTWEEFPWDGTPWGASVFAGWSLYHTELFFSAVLAKSGKITIRHNTPVVMKICRIYLGGIIRPFRNCDFGWTLQWKESTEQHTTEGGTILSDPQGEPYRQIAFTLPWLNPTDRKVIADFYREVGQRTDVFFSLMPNAKGRMRTDNAMPCKLIETSAIDHSSPNIHSTSIVLQET